MIRKLTNKRFGGKFRKPPPVCPKHGCVMLVGSSPEGVRYFYCPVKTCTESAQRSKDDR